MFLVLCTLVFLIDFILNKILVNLQYLGTIFFYSLFFNAPWQFVNTFVNILKF